MNRNLYLILIMMSLGQSVFAEELISVEKALKKMYPKAVIFEGKHVFLTLEQIRHIEEKADITINGMHSSEMIVHIAKENGNIFGFAFEDTVAGKWGPIHYLVGLDTQGIVLEVIILDYQEIRGRPVAKRRFVQQYQGKSIRDPVRLRKDINGVSGATISSRSVTDGVRKVLHIYEEVKESF